MCNIEVNLGVACGQGYSSIQDYLNIRITLFCIDHLASAENLSEECRTVYGELQTSISLL